MCFSNLPIEFDEQGNPYLADAADEVDQPEGRMDDADTVDEDPEAAYAAIIEHVPENVRDEFGDAHIDADSGRDDRRESARSD